MGWLLDSANNLSADAIAAQDLDSSSFKQGLTPKYIEKLSAFLKEQGYTQNITDKWDEGLRQNLIDFQNKYAQQNAQKYENRRNAVNALSTFTNYKLQSSPMFNALSAVVPLLRTSRNPVMMATLNYISGKDNPITEKYFNKRDLKFLGNVVADQINTGYYKTKDGDVSNSFGPQNYPNKKYGKIPGTSAFNIGYGIGRGNFETEGDNYVITDRFDPGSNGGKSGFFGKIENVINAFTGKREPIQTRVVLPGNFVNSNVQTEVEQKQGGGTISETFVEETEPAVIDDKFPTWKEYRDAQASKISDQAVANMLDLQTPLIPPHEVGQTPHTCIYTVTGMYGQESQEQNNIKFRANPRKYGFRKTDEAEVGDVIQLSKLPNAGNIKQLRWPHHMVVVTDVDENGELGVSYTNGGMNDGDLRKNKYNLHQTGRYGFGDWHRQQPYEFIGTKEQRKQWKEDYKSLKNK